MHHTITKRVISMEKSPVEYDKIEISGTRPVSHRKHLPIGRHLEFLQAGQ